MLAFLRLGHGRRALHRRTLSTQLPSEVETLIVGGGVIGSSVAYHLSQHSGHGERTLLVEAQTLTSGTTWHAAGLIGQLRPTEAETELSRYGTQLYASLEAETGQHTDWKPCGSLTLARTRDRLRHLERLRARAAAFGIAAELIGPQEARQLWPMMQVDDVLAALHLPEEGTADPSSVTQALIKGAKQRGVRVHERCRVVAVDVQQRRGVPVACSVEVRCGDDEQAPRQTVRVQRLVLCGGMWTRKLGRLCGVNVPLYPAEHFYIVTDTMEQVHAMLPFMRDPDGYTYFREWGSALLCGGFEPDAKPAFTSAAGVPDRFEHQLFDEDWQHFEVLSEQIFHRVPGIGAVRQMVNGPESFTADNAYILGQAPELANVFVAAGFNSSGIASAPGAGRALAEWIVNERPRRDLWTVDVRRFAPFQNNAVYLQQRCAESLGLHYAMAWPRRELESARGLRRSPLYDRLRDAGAQFGSKFGWERPNFFTTDDVPRRADHGQHTFDVPYWFEHVQREHLAARRHVAVFDQSSFAKLLVQGRDACAVLQRLCGADVDVPVGRVVYTAMMNARGGVETDVTVTRLAEREFLVVTSTAQATRDRHWLATHIDHDRDFVTVTDVTSAYAVLSVMGPRSRQLLSSLSPAGGFDDDAAAPLGSARTVDIGPVTVRASRVTYVGELGWELYAPTETAALLYDQLKHGNPHLTPVDAGYYAIDSLRTEKAYRAWGHDLSPDYSPLESGLGFAVAWDKPHDFVGKPALLAQRAAGLAALPRRLLSFVVVDPPTPPAARPDYWLLGGETILHNGRPCGVTTSSNYGFSLDAGVALGYVATSPALPAITKESIAKPGDLWQLNLAGRLLTVRPSLAPPFDPSNLRVKGTYQ